MNISLSLNGSSKNNLKNLFLLKKFIKSKINVHGLDPDPFFQGGSRIRIRIKTKWILSTGYGLTSSKYIIFFKFILFSGPSWRRRLINLKTAITRLIFTGENQFLNKMKNVFYRFFWSLHFLRLKGLNG